MGCEQWREALSARADGEAPGVDEFLLDRHLAGCTGCRSFADGLSRLHARTRVRSAGAVPDLTDAILAALAAQRPRRAWPALVLRWALVAIAALEIGLAAPELLGRWHTGGELGTWEVASGVGFLSVAARPRWASQMLPMLSAATLLTVFVISHDIAIGTVVLSAEWPHALLLIGVAALTVIARLNRIQGPPDLDDAYVVGAGGATHRLGINRAA
jgi:predicted anti-sigma-YlaC factor YlaD